MPQTRILQDLWKLCQSPLNGGSVAETHLGDKFKVLEELLSLTIPHLLGRSPDPPAELYVAGELGRSRRIMASHNHNPTLIKTSDQRNSNDHRVETSSTLTGGTFFRLSLSGAS